MGENQLWRQHEDVPALPDSAYRVWKPVVPEHKETMISVNSQASGSNGPITMKLGPFKIGSIKDTRGY